VKCSWKRRCPSGVRWPCSSKQTLKRSNVSSRVRASHEAPTAKGCPRRGSKLSGEILDLGISFSRPWPKVDGFSIGLRQKRPAMTLLCKLDRLAAEEQVSSLDEARLKRELKARSADIRGLLERHVGSARRLSKTLVENPLHCEAVREGDRKSYRTTGTESYLPLLPEQLAMLQSVQGRCSV